jgi:1-acyl-sn-glycerol-3-phosphate acyltransferase
MVYPISKIWIYPICCILTKRIRGIGNVPSKPPFIVVSNHERLIDPFYILYIMIKKLNKKIHFIAEPTWWFLGDMGCRQWAGCIPLFNSKQAYNEIKKYLLNNKIIGIFPEGNYKKMLAKNFKTGFVRLAIETKIPILPVGIKSSYIPFTTTLNIGKLIYLKKGSKNIEKQTSDLMKLVYSLRDVRI